jgi:hypothetical protein
MYDEYDDVIVCLYDNMYRYCRNPKISEKNGLRLVGLRREGGRHGE